MTKFTRNDRDKIPIVCKIFQSIGDCKDKRRFTYMTITGEVDSIKNVLIRLANNDELDKKDNKEDLESVTNYK